MSNSNLDSAVGEVVVSAVQGKKFWFSKTFWVNVLAGGALLVQTKYGFVVGAETQAVLLSLVNLVLRSVTSKPIEW